MVHWWTIAVRLGGGRETKMPRRRCCDGPVYYSCVCFRSLFIFLVSFLRICLRSASLISVRIFTRNAHTLEDIGTTFWPYIVSSRNVYVDTYVQIR
jgi:hypothetical protein